MEGGDFVHAVGRQARAVCGGVEGRQPERVHAEIGEGPRFDVSGHAREVTAHPVGPWAALGKGAGSLLALPLTKRSVISM